MSEVSLRRLQTTALCYSFKCTGHKLNFSQKTKNKQEKNKQTMSCRQPKTQTPVKKRLSLLLFNETDK
uniref:Uncharacterized protein n=1 Tax=Anguilla anguilla TaxID=7936 RepID=A0A0E9Q5Y2_ANGAN